MKSKIGIRGRVKLACYKKDGSLKWDTGWIENTITVVGLAVVAGLVGNKDSQVAFTFLAVGTDDTATSAGHTLLQAETTTNGLERTAATITRETTAETNDTLQLAHEWTATGTVVVEEIGVFNVVTTNTVIMLGRSLTGTKTVNNGEKLNSIYQIIFS